MRWCQLFALSLVVAFSTPAVAQSAAETDSTRVVAPVSPKLSSKLNSIEVQSAPARFQGFCVDEDTSGENWSWAKERKCKPETSAIAENAGDKDSSQIAAPPSPKLDASTDELGSLIAGILGEINDRWSEVFQAGGQTYSGPKIVLFRNATNGGSCGMVQAAMGPFYCAPDRKIFLNTGTFKEIETRLNGCSGNACRFTAAYVIARQVGHNSSFSISRVV
jgi:hypothetical protein